MNQKEINNLLYNDITPKMTSSVTPSPHSIVLGSEASIDTWNIFDGDINTSSRNSIHCNPLNSWWYIDMGTKVQIDAYSLYWNNTVWTANSWRIEGSNDTITWNILDMVEPFRVESGRWIDFIIDNSGEYRYYKMQPLTKQNDNSIMWSEIILWQSAPQPIKIYKTLEKNIPIYTNEQEIHLTEIGNIYVSKNDGTFIKMNGEEVKPYEEQNKLLRQEIEQISKILDVVNGRVITTEDIPTMTMVLGVLEDE